MVSLTSLQVRILVNGKPIKQYWDGNKGIWIEARDGSNYSIEIKNNSFERVLAVLSVDGINVISGKEAEVTAGDGYVIDPFAHLEVEGWRVSDTKVKQFFFSFNKEKAYAVKVGGDSRNLGVIGVAFFSEKQPYSVQYVATASNYPLEEFSRKFDFNSAPPIDLISNDGPSLESFESDSTKFTCSVNSSKLSHHSPRFKQGMEKYSNDTIPIKQQIDFKAATGKGRDVDSKVREVLFSADICIGTTVIYYDSYDNLVARGILKPQQQYPAPFKQTGYCPDI